MPPSAELRTFSVTSMNGAKAATNSEAGAISTAVRPDGTSSSPKVMRLNGSAIASVPSSSARPGRARSSARGGARLGAAVAQAHHGVQHDARRARSGSTRSPRAEVLERVLDQEVRAAPHGGESGEQSGVARGHSSQCRSARPQAPMTVPDGSYQPRL